MNKIRLAVVAGALALLAITTLAQTFPTSENFRVTDTFSDVRKKLNQSGVTISQLQKVAATPAAIKTNLGIQSGSVTTSANGTVTNTFGTAFASAPVVVISQTGSACTTTNILTVTATGFVYNAGAPSIVVKWIAVGAP